jgi:hypothetical protein
VGNYEAPKHTAYNVFRNIVGGIGVLAMGLLALFLLDRLLMKDCYDKAGTYDDTCSQGAKIRSSE